jgi:hypothetical protein
MNSLVISDNHYSCPACNIRNAPCEHSDSLFSTDVFTYFVDDVPDIEDYYLIQLEIDAKSDNETKMPDHSPDSGMRLARQHSNNISKNFELEQTVIRHGAKNWASSPREGHWEEVAVASDVIIMQSFPIVVTCLDSEIFTITPETIVIATTHRLCCSKYVDIGSGLGDDIETVLIIKSYRLPGKPLYYYCGHVYELMINGITVKLPFGVYCHLNKCYHFLAYEHFNDKTGSCYSDDCRFYRCQCSRCAQRIEEQD